MSAAPRARVLAGGGPIAREAVETALALARERSDLGAFWALGERRALADADALDRRRGGAATLPLGGIAVAIKDLFDVAGLPTTAGLAGERTPAVTDALAVHRLRAAGGVPIGKTAMDPLGASTGGQAPGFAPCRNPRDPRLSPGGSSSGSAVAVAAGIVPLALGTDTAGSVRIPAAYCAITGLKPALGWVPRRGCVTTMPTFDAPGVLAPSVAGCVDGLAALSSRAAPLELTGHRLTIGVLADLIEASEPPVAEACREAVARLADEPAIEVAETRLEWRPRGFGAALAFELASTWGERVEAEPDRFTELIRETVAFGREVGRERHDEIVAELTAARRRLGRRFADFDAIISPTVPTPAPDLEAEEVGVSTAFTRVFNAINWHAISIPASETANGRPIGIQLAAAPPRLATLLEAARRLERVLGGPPPPAVDEERRATAAEARSDR